MIVVADSGSTKCDWLILERKTEKRTETNTMGFNPMFHDELFISNEIYKNEILRQLGPEVKYVYFYCAGGSSEELRSRVQRGLHLIFTNAHIEVDHDLDGAVFATCDGQPGIACILGTGSNSCYFDGKELHEEVPALGYILGDEGSGSWYGRILLRDFLYKRMPEDIYHEFQNRFDLTKNDIFKNVYMKPHANVYLASFMRFVSDNREHQYIKDMVDEGMYEFMNAHVCCFKNYREVPVHFVGSIAFYFEPILRRIAQNLNINVGKITNKPVEGLVKHHLAQLAAQP
ncbi:MAG: hypothetical protein IPH78_00190 [Bacteroidetes bacterium]|nr:hypothetical protein [Bacteroidota bacterium]